MKFLENKYSRWYFQIINNRFNNTPVGYYESHHVVPKSLSGEDSKANLVKLTAREHYICHLLLTKMVEKDSIYYKKMWKAFGLMAWYSNRDQKRQYRINNRIYQKLKTEFSIAQSFFQSGSGNSGYGKKWYYNEELRQSIKTYPNQIEKGWKEGRVINWDRYFKSKERKKIRVY